MTASSPTPGTYPQLQFAAWFQLPLLPFQVQVAACALREDEKNRKPVRNSTIIIDRVLIFIAHPPVLFCGYEIANIVYQQSST
jgi:hypothetical protein